MDEARNFFIAKNILQFFVERAQPFSEKLALTHIFAFRDHRFTKFCSVWKLFPSGLFSIVNATTQLIDAIVQCVLQLNVVKCRKNSIISWKRMEKQRLWNMSSGHQISVIVIFCIFYNGVLNNHRFDTMVDDELPFVISVQTY